MRNSKQSRHNGTHAADDASLKFSHDADAAREKWREEWREKWLDETRTCQQCGATVRRGDMEPTDQLRLLDKGFCSRKCEGEFLHDWEKALRFNNPWPYLERVGVPPRYRTCTEENFTPASDSQKRAAKILREWVPAGDGSGIFLTGKPGIGKTHLVTAWLRRMIIANPQHRFRFQPVAELFRQLRRSFDHDSNLTESGITDELIKVGVLVLDDLGTERTSAYVLDSLYVILDGRYSAMRSTIVTSNLSLSAIAERYDPRLASRMAEGIVVKMDGPDHRLANSKSRCAEK